MKIALCFYGLNRSLSITHRSILEQVIAPWSQAHEVKLFGAFLQPAGGIHNPRSQELGVPVEQDSLGLLAFDATELVDQAQLDQAIGFDGFLPELKDYYADGHQSTRNIFRSLFALRQAHALARQSFDPDIVVFLRPDLFYIDRWDTSGMLGKLQASGPQAVLTPIWQQWGGLNDRLAVCSRTSAQVFASRFEHILEFVIATEEGIQAERLLLWHCLQQGLDFSSCFAERAIRVRATGLFREENFAETGIAVQALTRYRSLLGLPTAAARARMPA